MVKFILKTARSKRYKVTDEEIAGWRSKRKKPNACARNIVEFNRQRQLEIDVKMSKSDDITA